MERPFECRCDPSFAPLLEPGTLDALETRRDTAYGLWPDLTLAYMNPAWFKFAEFNGGGESLADRWRVGRSTLDAVPKPLQAWYRSFLAEASTPGLKPAFHEYECSSPDVYRRYVMTVYPKHLGDLAGLLIIHSLRVEVAHPLTGRAAEPPDMRAYVDRNGLIHQCMHCRRIRTTADPSLWHWVPDWVRQPMPQTSHDLCRICMHHYYGQGGGTEMQEGSEAG